MFSAVVDGPEEEAAVEKALRREAVKAILNGAAIFYPNKQSRRDKLFHMMVKLLFLPMCVFMKFLCHLCHLHSVNKIQVEKRESLRQEI